jgi:hypothetical protein
MDAMQLIDEVFLISPSIRYVAVRRGDQVERRQRPELPAASSSTSDWYEETLVNPTLLTLARQRGNIDCGGLRCLVVGYGNFSQLVVPLDEHGHVSVAFELDADPLHHLDAIKQVAARGPDQSP